MAENSEVVLEDVMNVDMDSLMQMLAACITRFSGPSTRNSVATILSQRPDLGRILGYRGIPGLSTQIKNSYTRVILPFEHFCDRARNVSYVST
jgi:hypothetical protein